MPAPGGDVVEVVAGRDRGAHHQQQHLAQRIHHPPGLARVLKLGKVLQKQRQAVPRRVIQDRDSGHRALPQRITAPGNHVPQVNSNQTPIAR